MNQYHPHSVYKHRKGGVYTMIGILDGTVYYVAHKDGRLWWRPREEFFDGRFTRSEESPLTPSEIGHFERG